jgi:hypothetical protein
VEKVGSLLFMTMLRWKWLKKRWREREREKIVVQTKLGRRLFFADFGPDFLLSQTMESTRIYRRWKMDISFLLVSNIGL